MLKICEKLDKEIYKTVKENIKYDKINALISKRKRQNSKERAMRLKREINFKKLMTNRQIVPI